MRIRKKVNIAVWLLAASVLAADVSGNSLWVYAGQMGAGGVFTVQEEAFPMQKGEVSADTGEETAEEDSLKSQAEKAFAALLREYEMYGVLTSKSDIPVLQYPFYDAPLVKALPSGYQVRFQAAVVQEGEIWFQVAFAVNGVEFSGYVKDSHVISQDDRLQKWITQYFSSPKSRAAAISSVTPAEGTDLSAFPSSYRSYLQKLIKAHPNWTFVPLNTGLKWSEVVENEMVNARNLVPVSSLLLWKSTAAQDYNMATGAWIPKDGQTWVQASESVVKHFLDPRNFLNEESVFQFEQLTYNGAYHNVSGVEKILSGTFMGNKKLEDNSGGGITYAQAFMKIGKELKVSPYFLASRVRQEQGVKGDSALISGTYPGYKGYYNYFNISATGLGDQVIVNGLKEAKAEKWTTRYAALFGGAEKTAERYITRGQDTFYLQKFDVDASYDGLYWHQYMQNLQAADNESKNVRKSYESMGAINNKFVFKVPVYKNMPSAAYPKPGEKLEKTTLTAKKDGYTVNLSWKETSGAQGYQVYRKEGSGGTYKLAKSLSGLGSTSWQDNKIEVGKTYYYKVRSYFKWKEGTMRSSYSSEQKADYAIPAASLQSVKVKNYTTVQLSWNKKSVTGYRIYRKTDSGKYVSLAVLKGSGILSYKDSTVEPGHTYSYKIRSYKTVDGKNYYSKYSSVKQAEVKMKVPSLKSARASGSKVKLTWKRDTKASGYYLYRSEKKKGGYKKIQTISGNKKLSWTDSGVSKKKTYYYKIRSYVKTSKGKKSSSYSKPLQVKR
ncbi:hypothetical protein AALA98_12940 [Lachnospiraceae bacterium 45-W7]